MKNIIVLSAFIMLYGHIQSQELHTKANDFLKTLSPELKSQTLFSLSDEERFNFNFVPIARKGPTFKDFNERQKQAALTLLRVSLSQEGFRKTSEIMELENILIVLENNSHKMPDGSPMRDPLNYHFCVFGEPSPDSFWGWRFEGHHVSLNFVASKGVMVASTPSFFGSNPGIVKDGKHKGKEVLKQETDLGFALVNSLSQEQLKIARFADKAPREILTSNKRKAMQLTPMGIPYVDLSPVQKAAFLKLMNVYIDNYEHGFSKTFRAKINKAGMDKLSFAWAGSLQPGAGHYYRIQGPMLLIEYDNIQNNANHVHTIVRDLTNDFAEDLLKDHYHNHH